MYLLLLPLVEHRPPTRILQPTLSWVLLSSCFPLLFILLMCGSDSRRNMFFSLPLFLLPLGFQVKACFVMQLDDYRNVYPINLKLIFPILSSAEIWFVFCYSRLLLRTSSQRVWSILHRQLFINVCTFLVIVILIL